jgi:hypothetical protein
MPPHRPLMPPRPSADDTDDPPAEPSLRYVTLHADTVSPSRWA